MNLSHEWLIIGHEETINKRLIDKRFCKKSLIPRVKNLEKRNQRNNINIKLKMEYEPSLPNIENVWRKNTCR